MNPCEEFLEAYESFCRISGISPNNNLIESMQQATLLDQCMFIDIFI